MAFDDYTKSNLKSLYYRSQGDRTTALYPAFTPVKTQFSETYYRAETDSVTGKKNPAYRVQIRDVRNATTPCTGSKTLYVIHRHPHAFLQSVYKEGTISQSNMTMGVSGFRYNILSGINIDYTAASVLASVENRAIQKLYKQLNAFVSSAKTGEDIGELRQTMNALRQPLKPLSKLLNRTFVDASKAFSRRGAPAIAKAAADTWLQFQFGYLPLAKNIHDAVYGLRNRQVLYNYRPFHATDFDVAGDTSRWDQAVVFGNIVYDGIFQRQTKYQVTYQGVWAEEAQLPERAIESVIGLQARDVLPTIWNLIPYSFLVDYFTNIGEIAGSLAVPWGGVRWCNKTVRSEFANLAVQAHRQNYTAGELPFTKILSWEVYDGIIIRKRTTFVRSAQPSLPYPSLELENPLDWTWKRWANLAALVLLKGTGHTKMVQRKVAQHPNLPQLFSRELDYRGFRALRNQ